MQKIDLRGNVPSSKNSKVWTGRFLVNSKLTAKYIKETENQWVKNKEVFLKMLEGKEAPYRVHLYFRRKGRHRFDYINAAQVIFDLMQKYDWLEDDSAYDIIPVFDGFEVNKEDPGVLIHVN